MQSSARFPEQILVGHRFSDRRVADKTTKEEFPAADQIGAKVHAATQSRGLITRLRGDVYNLAPCFTVEESTIDRMVQILGESIEEVLGS